MPRLQAAANPFILMMDPGGANKGQVMQNLCKRLGIQPLWH